MERGARFIKRLNGLNERHLMYIQPEALEGFQRFCRLNREHWRIDDRYARTPSTGKVILVDLLSHDFNHHVRTALTAKYLQRITGGRLVGIVGRTVFNERLFPSRYHETHARHLAQSFGIDTFLELDGVESDDEDGRRVVAELEALSKNSRPRAIFGLTTADGLEIGRYMYETCVRIATTHKLLDWGDLERRIAIDTYATHRAIRAYVRQNHVAAYVTGHITFNQWGLVADVVLREGGHTLYVNHDGNFSVDILRRAPRIGETLLGVRREQRNALMNRFLRSADRLSGLEEKVTALLGTGKIFQPFWWVPQKQAAASQRSALRQHGRTKLDLQDDKRPVYGIISHCFSDAPTADHQLYFDYHDWLERTLSIAANDTTKVWLCKVHPSMKSYGGEETMNALIERFKGHAHLRFVHEDLTRAELFAVCDCAITIRGSLGYDMAAAGVPVIAAGESNYSALDIAIVPKTVAAYEELLTRPAAELPRDPTRAVRAKQFILYNVGLFRVGSLLLEPNWSKTPEVWNELASRLQANMYELDPAFTCLAGSMALELPMCVNLTFARWLEPDLVVPADKLAWHSKTSDDPAAAGGPAELASVTYSAGRTLQVGLGGDIEDFLVAGLAVRSDGGVIVSGRPALFHFRFDESLAETGGVFVELAPTNLQEARLEVRVNGTLCGSLGLRADRMGRAAIIEVPVAETLAEAVLELHLITDRPGYVVLKQLAMGAQDALQSDHATTFTAFAMAAEALAEEEQRRQARAVALSSRLRQSEAWQYVRALRRRVRQLVDAPVK